MKTIIKLVLAYLLIFSVSCNTQNDPDKNENGTHGTGGKTNSSKNAEVVQISAGQRHTLVLLSDNTLWGTGASVAGQLTSIGNRYQDPKLFKIAENVKYVKALRSSTLILKTDDTLWGVGNSSGELGQPEPYISEFKKIADNVKSISGGSYHTLFIKKDNTLWGCGGRRQLEHMGAGNDNPISPFKIADDVKEAAGGDGYTLILKNDNTLYGQGATCDGGLGIDCKLTANGQIIPQYTKIADGVKRIFAGYNSSAIIKLDNSLWLTGDNWGGQLGVTPIYEKTDVLPLTKVLKNVKEVAFGNRHSLILLEDNTLLGAGEVHGNPAYENEYTFVKLTDNVKTMTAGEKYSLVLKNDKTLWAAGSSSQIQLGIPNKLENGFYEKTFQLVSFPWKE